MFADASQISVPRITTTSAANFTYLFIWTFLKFYYSAVGGGAGFRHRLWKARVPVLPCTRRPAPAAFTSPQELESELGLPRIVRVRRAHTRLNDGPERSAGG